MTQAIEAAHPARPEPYFELASALQAAGKLDEAIAEYRVSLKFDLQYSPALLGLGLASRQAGLLVQAARQLQPRRAGGS